MAKRLVEQYSVGERVSIRFSGDSTAQWRSGLIVRIAHPGIWVRLVDGRQWFVTNTRRIRPDNGGSRRNQR